MYNHGTCSPGMFSATLDAAAQDQRGLEQVQGKAPKTKAKVVRMVIQEIVKRGYLFTLVSHYKNV